MFNSLPNFQVPDPPIARFALQNAFSLSSVVTLSFSLRSIICEVLSAKGTKLPGVKQLPSPNRQKSYEVLKPYGAL